MCKVSFEVNDDLKRNADELFNALGFDLGIACNMFLAKAVHENGMPFDLKIDIPNHETVAALNECDQIVNDIKAGKRKPCKNTNELWQALNV